MKQIYNLNSDDKSNTLSRRLQGKRLLAINATCKVELKKEIPLLFSTFYEAQENTNKALAMFPPHSRSRTLEASIMQSCFAESLFNNFRKEASYGKYKRLIFRTKGYIILFKKLNSKGVPMNIKTANNQSILNQNHSLDLFSDTEYNDEPILYFGYQKNKFGSYVNPQVVYIDDAHINFTIDENDIVINMESVNTDQNVKQVDVKPTLKEKNQFKKAI
jgi:hypothetical protein